MVDFIVIFMLVFLLGSAVFYIIKAKRKGAGCIGCPSAGQCAACRQGKGSCEGSEAR